jgi:hypothetical protein
MIEELFDRGAQAAALPDAAETTLKSTVTLDEYGSVEGTSESTAYECSRGVKWYVDGAIHRRDLCDRNAPV